LTVAAGSTRGTGRTLRTGVARGSGVARLEGFGLSRLASFAGRTIGTRFAGRTRGTLGTRRARRSILSGTAGVARFSGVARGTGRTRWTGGTLWAWLARGRGDGNTRRRRGLSRHTGHTGGTGLARLTRQTGRSGGSGWSGKAAALATALDVGVRVDDGLATVAGLTAGSVVGGALRDGLEVVHLTPDVLRTALAELHLVVHLLADMLNVVVDHGKRDADGKDCDNAEGHSGIGHELVGLDPTVHLHPGWRCEAPSRSSR